MFLLVKFYVTFVYYLDTNFVTMNYKKITQYKINDTSPFINDLVEMEISNRRRIIAGKSSEVLVNNTTGEVHGSTVFAINEKVDKEEFTKIYRKGLAGMFGLSRAGIKVFAFIATIVKPNKDMIYFEIKDCKKFTGYKSHQPINTGLSELIESKFIARTDAPYRYFINPTMFFNGSRVAFIKIYETENNTPPELL